MFTAVRNDMRIARGIRTGVILVNSARSVRTEAPFGGFKQSGVGRALGMAAMDDYTEVKNTFFIDEFSARLLGGVA